jgi:PhzF family phenazine biosynthesis protein
METEVILVRSFTANGRGGNPAGVVVNAPQLSQAQKLKIAQIVGYSETAFVTADNEVDWNVSFFTTTGEVDFCGHATLAAFSVLYQKGLITTGKYIQRTRAGLLPIVVTSDGQVLMEQQLPQFLGSFHAREVSALIGIDAEVIESTQLPIEAISTGLPDMMIPVPFGYLDRIQPNQSLIVDFCQKYELVGLHVYELYPPESELTASCRNFAPLYGIPEESATGSSSGALACYLSKYLPEESTSTERRDYVFEQGRAMQCTSKITASVTFQNSEIVKVEVGGQAHETGLRHITV